MPCGAAAGYCLLLEVVHSTLRLSMLREGDDPTENSGTPCQWKPQILLLLSKWPPSAPQMCDAPRLQLLREILVVGIQLRALGHVAVPRVGIGDNLILVVFWYPLHCSSTVPPQPCKGHRRDCAVCPA